MRREAAPAFIGLAGGRPGNCLAVLPSVSILVNRPSRAGLGRGPTLAARTFVDEQSVRASPRWSGTNQGPALGTPNFAPGSLPPTEQWMSRGVSSAGANRAHLLDHPDKLLKINH